MNDRLIAILFEIIKSLRRVSGRTRLMKMVYLVDLMTAQKTGHAALGIKWSGYVSGPFSNEVINTLAHMDGRYIEEEWYTDIYGDRHYIYSIPEGGPALNPPHLNDPLIERILSQVIKKWGERPLAELVDYVYTTKPFQNSGLGIDIKLESEVAR
ncbi:MAG TPA: type II toxin-antitoxin system antitoxin SocA domain-containing protein [Armatimonadota bacterium]|nr:type II toxin-antitoxin system antitoxin SocA domain-containing protein [Armatimonadota bacterium]